MKKRLFTLTLLFLILQSLIFCNIENSLKPSQNLVSGTLENGLKYYIFKNKKPENRASLNLVVNAGSLYETEDQQGLAHFLEHMAFNGTTKYKKNELVKYLQSLGLSFGGDLNAYTSFSETVYKLQVPSSIKDLEIGFDVLKEWSSELTLDPKDVESEKKIIIEEWRLSQGIRKRVGDLQKKIIYGDSWYSKRFPIGLNKTINGASSELLREYYEKWYQPKNFSIVAVGDFNVDEIKSIIVKTFSSLKNNSNIVHSKFDIPFNKKNSVTIFTDSELTTTNFNIMWKQPVSPIISEADFKKNLENILFNSILNTRFSIFSKSKSSPYISSTIYNFPLNSETGIYAISSLVREENINSTIINLIDNLKEISINGISKTELENEKINLLNNLKTIVNNKESIQNSTYMESIVDYILNNNVFIDPDVEYNLTKNLLKKINSNDIKTIAKNLLSSNYDVLITSRENMKDKLPSENDIENTINTTLKENVTSLKNQNYDLNLPELDLIPGTTKKISTEKDFLKFQLSNGIDVIYKETEFDKDKIMFKLTKLQGSSSLEYPDYINSIFLSNIISNSGVGNIDYKSLELYFKGKNFSVEPYIDDYTQGFIISTNKENLNEALKYFRTLIADPKFDSNIIESTLKTNSELIKNRDFSPKSVLKKTYLELLNNNNPRKTSLSLEDLNYINNNRLKETFKNLFSNFKDYKLTITGSIDEKSLINDLNYYFANLPVDNNSKTFKDLKIKYPSNDVQKTIVKGIDKKATVILTFPYHGDFSLENRALYNGFSKLLNILLIENVREKIGGVYSISSSANLEKLNFGENYLQIIFSTDNKRVNEVINKVKSTIEEIQKGSFPKNKIVDIQKNYELNFETALKTNSFWNSFLDKKNLISDYEFYAPMRYNNIVNFNSIVDFSNRALKINNFVEVILLPEKED